MPTEHHTGEDSGRDDPIETEAQDDDRGGAAAAEVVALRRERDDFEDRWKRSAAEFENYRRRTERERRDLAEAAAADLIRDLLPIVDDFERALTSADTASAGPEFRRGVEIIHKQLLDALRKRGAQPFDSVGEQFDPSWHEAVAHEPAGDRPDGEITAEFRRGYRLGSRLLRPAQVKVAKA
jgi:molecular chaperone GrpE